MRTLFALGFVGLLASGCATLQGDTCKPTFNVTGPAQSCTRTAPLAVLTPDREEIKINDRIQFEFAKADLKPESTPVLQSVATVIRAHPEIQRVRIEGHASAEGGPDFNRKLSQERAEAVRQYLIKAGIPESRLEAIGHGTDRPIAPNDDELSREKNRRCEFKVEKGS
jgi:outer membrane protein OmpA-like peptidoglycan-associated protein